MLEMDLEKKDKECIEKNDSISFMKKTLEKQDLNIEELKMLNLKLEKKLS